MCGNTYAVVVLYAEHSTAQHSTAQHSAAQHNRSQQVHRLLAAMRLNLFNARVIYPDLALTSKHKVMQTAAADAAADAD